MNIKAVGRLYRNERKCHNLSMRILVSGFEAFGGHEVNPTALLIASLYKNEIPYPKGMEIEGIVLPVTFEYSYELLKEKIEAFNPDVVISLGLAEKRMAIEIESLAVNKIHAPIPDNKGLMPQNQLISAHGPEGYHSTLPLQGIEGALKASGVTVTISNSAGHFVCNDLFYRLMADNQESQRLCGFIHVPLVKEQSPEAPLFFSELQQALSVIFHYLDY